MATLAVATISRGLTTKTLASAGASGDVFPNNGKSFLVIKNANAGATRTLTIQPLKKVDGQTPAAIVLTLAISSEYVIGCFPPSIYNDALGQVSLVYSNSGADLTVGVFSL